MMFQVVVIKKYFFPQTRIGLLATGVSLEVFPGY
jgi:hypothetical protein